MSTDTHEHETTNYSALIDEICAEMGRKRLSQVALARRLGRPQPWLNRRLMGHTDMTFPEIEVIADTLGLSVWDLLSRARRSVSGVTHTTGWYQRSAAQQGHTEHTRMPAPQRTHLLDGARNRAEATVIRFPVAV